MERLSRRSVGTTQATVTELGFGAAPLGNLYRSIDGDAAQDAVSAALDAGIAYFDTAPFYGLGLSERRLGDALRDREAAVLSTKVGRLLKPDPTVHGLEPRHGFHSPMPFRPCYDYSFDGVMTSWEASQHRLGLVKIDILYVHDVGRLTHGDYHEVAFRQLADGGGFRALEELRAAGAIQAFGLGVNETAVCLDAMEQVHLDVILLAGRYTLLEQDALEDLLPACARAGTSIVVGGPYNSGILATGTKLGGPLHYNYEIAPPSVVERVRRIEVHCDRHGIPLAAAALQFPLAHPQVASVIPGLDSRHQVARTLELYHTNIPDPFWQELKAEGLLHPAAPVPAVRC
ncbi:MAG: aldo/keto reductase [Pseudomonadota bacterium]|nr:aldo/keto reductase [Pseudomonadota bacterium]